jgi:serum/glucocorticoid-regulated kinase 2
MPQPSAQNPNRNRDSLQRKQLWWLPYVVLEFDKNEVLVDALGGDLNSPVWMYGATFDVSRISEIGLTVYLRTSSPGSTAAVGDGENGGSGGQGKGDGEDMGNGDLCLGGLRFVPDLESGVSVKVKMSEEELKMW